MVFAGLNWIEGPRESRYSVTFPTRFTAENDMSKPASQHQFVRLRTWVEKHRPAVRIKRVFDQLMTTMGVLHSLGLTMLFDLFNVFVTKRDCNLAFAHCGEIVEFSKESFGVEICRVSEVVMCLLEALPQEHEYRTLFEEFVQVYIASYDLAQTVPIAKPIPGQEGRIGAKSCVFTGVEKYLHDLGFVPTSLDLRVTEGVFHDDVLKQVVLKATSISDEQMTEWRSLAPKALASLPAVNSKIIPQ